jgi:hypothetical protein
VIWSYKLNAISTNNAITDTYWHDYSSFTVPKIENPFFNIGIFDKIGPFATFSNPPSGNAYFYQAGVSSNTNQIYKHNQEIKFLCPSYYSSNGTNQCMSTKLISDGNSHWKVLWKWGIQPDSE